jgi:glycosyltransferase involved in cell wall biosynthesis
MRILFVGLPHFGKKVVKDLRSFAPEHSFSFYDTYYSRAARIKFALNLPFADLVISMNGASDRSGSLDMVLGMKKKLWLQWQGTDVLLALERSGNSNINRKYIDYGYNFTDAPWLRDELQTAGIECELAGFKWLRGKELPPAFSEVSVYSYLSRGREDFYGWEIIRRLAEKNPEIPFYIAGTDGRGLEASPNVQFKGWLPSSEMQVLQENTPVYLRLPRHDGYSLTVLEALSCGSEVIWSMQHEKCNFLPSSGNAEILFSRVLQKLHAGNLARNGDNMEYTRSSFSEEKVLGRLLLKIEEIAKG